MSDIKKAGDSTEQREMEPIILAQLEKMVGLERGSLLESVPECLEVMKLDGFHAGLRPIVVEVWAHQGRAKGGQQHKVLKDMCKLLLAERLLEKPCRKIFVVSDVEAVAHLRNSWQGSFAEVFGIDILVVDVPVATRRKVREAQKRQFR